MNPIAGILFLVGLTTFLIFVVGHQAVFLTYTTSTIGFLFQNEILVFIIIAAILITIMAMVREAF
jgi:hypothetical protein